MAKLRRGKADVRPKTVHVEVDVAQIEREMLAQMEAPQKDDRVRLPTIWQIGQAGVFLTNAPGEGRKRLDEYCKAHGYTWGIVATYERGNATCVSVLIGSVYESAALSKVDGGLKAWDAPDQAFSALVDQLEEA